MYTMGNTTCHTRNTLSIEATMFRYSKIATAFITVASSVIIRYIKDDEARQFIKTAPDTADAFSYHFCQMEAV